MASDRGTLTRSGLSANQQDGWADSAGPAGRKLPSAQRERKPALFALAILLVALGAGAAGLLVIRAGGSQVQAIEVVQQVSQGQQIPGGALQEVDLPSTSALVSGNDYVPWSLRAQYTGFFARTTIMPNTLLTSAMAMRTNGLTANQELVGLSLKAGQVPADLMPGDQVNVVVVGTACGDSPTQTQPGIAQVISVSGDAARSGGTELVTVAAQQANAPGMACLSANGDLALTALPGNGNNASANG